MIFLILAVGLLVGVAFNRVAIQDWWFLRSYQPAAFVEQLATEAGMSDKGRQLFYRSDPQVVDRDALARNCAAGDLGCIVPTGQIYLLQPNPNDIKHDDLIATAAHEMLHQAYRRLSSSEKSAVSQQAEAYLSSVQHNDITEQLGHVADNAERADELHSLLGSEIGDLPSGLESYYGQYFTDRGKTVKAYTASR